jgi:type II secretory pathway pseudopilin PulG
MRTYPIPDEQRPALDSLPLDTQREIHAMLRIFWAVDHAPHGDRGGAWAAAIAAEAIRAEATGAAFALAKSTLYTRRKQYIEAGRDWAVLVDRRKVPDWDCHLRQRVPSAARGLPPAFRDFFLGLAEDNARSTRQAIQELYRQWRAGHAIPGYGTWHAWWSEHHQGPMPRVAPIPRGWGERQLHRLCSDKAALALARRGIAAARPLLPDIIRTRTGLRPMEYIVLDDWRADFLVHVPGYDQAVELNGILAMDVACAKALRFGVRPSLPRQDGSSEGLKRADTKSIVSDILLKYGWPRDYPCNLIVERGTATITPDDAAAIEQVTNGQVRVHWTSMISGAVFGWADKPVGNFRGKAWLESFFNLLHNACASLPGQIGAHYRLRPARVAAQEAECKALLRAQEALPDALRETINYQLPFLDCAQARDALNWVFHTLNDREDHALEGFERRLKFRLEETDPWRPVSLLIDKGWTPEMIRSIQPRPHMETPNERWARLAQGVAFQRLHKSSAPMLLADHKLVTIGKEGEVNMGSQSTPLRYRDRQNPYLKTGCRYLAYVSTQDDEWIHLTREDKGYVTSVPKAAASRHGDTEAASREIAERTSQLKAKIRDVTDRSPKTEKRLADLRHNNMMIEDQLRGMQLDKAPPTGSYADVPGHVAAVIVAEDTLADLQRQRRAEHSRIRQSTGSLADFRASTADILDPDETQAPTGMADLLKPR